MHKDHSALRAIYEGKISVVREFRGGSRLDLPEGVSADSVARICAWGLAVQCAPEASGAFSTYRIALTQAGIDLLEVIDNGR